MKPIPLLASVLAACLGLAASALASNAPTAQYLEHYKVLRTDVPQPIRVVAPTGLPQSSRNTTVTFAMLIDTEGVPHDVRVTSPTDAALSRILVPIISQWRFSPALQDGVPVARKVNLPIQLVES